MKIIASIILAFAVSGCATVVAWIPSFWDANQSARIVNIAVSADSIDCSGDQLAQAQSIQADIAWFVKYSETKGSRQQDVLRLVAPMQETVSDWASRAGSQRGASFAYCEIKRTVLQQQSTRAAEAVQGRF